MAIQITEDYASLIDETNPHYKTRNLVWKGGRGSGKSVNVARGLIIRGYKNKELILCTREFQNSIGDSVLKTLEEEISNLGLNHFYEVQANAIYGKNGTEFIFKGLRNNIQSIKSIPNISLCWIEEAQTVSDRSYEILIPTIRAPQSQIIVTFNPLNPTDPTWQRFVENAGDDTHVVNVNYDRNPWFPDVLRAEMEKLKSADYEAYEHIYQGKFDTRYSGAVYAKKIAAIRDEGRITDRVKHDPNYPVYCTFDLGYGDATAIIFYQIGDGEVFIIDYYENNTEDIRHYAEVMYGREIIIDERELDTGEVSKWHFGEDIEKHAHRKQYRYEAIYLPHDSKHRTLASGGRNIIGQIKKFDFKAFYIESTSDRNRHEAAWSTIPKCWINESLCRDFVSAMMYYHFEYDDDRKVFKEKPVHDWSSHACSSFELLSRIWTDKTLTIKEIDGRNLNNKFHRLRRENNMVQEDPYRMRKK